MSRATAAYRESRFEAGEGEPSSRAPAADLLPYPDPDAREAETRRLADALRAEVVRYGESVEGRPLLAVRVPATKRKEPRARVLVTANIHGPEWVACRVAHGFLQAMQSPSGALAVLRDTVEVWVAPCLNPDGYARTFERGGSGRLVELRTNARGVDLNRNFPLPEGTSYTRLPGGGSTRHGDATYRGEHPLSEPEAAHLAQLMDEVPFAASTNLHSFMGTLIPARVTSAGTFSAYTALCRAFLAAQPRRRYRRLSSRFLDGFTGELEDYQHHLKGTWAVCVEVFPVLESFRQHLVAPSLFWRFNPRDPAPWVENDVPGIAAFLLAAVERGPPSALDERSQRPRGGCGRWRCPQ